MPYASAPPDPQPAARAVTTREPSSGATRPSRPGRSSIAFSPSRRFSAARCGSKTGLFVRQRIGALPGGTGRPQHRPLLPRRQLRADLPVGWGSAVRPGLRYRGHW